MRTLAFLLPMLALLPIHVANAAPSAPTARASTPAARAPDAAPASESLTSPRFVRWQLSNGLDVVLVPDRSAPIVHTQVWYHVGSKDEVAGRTGFAHLFEHLMFQGSKNAPGEYFTPIQEVGGDLNGTTNSERTNYYETVPAESLPLALFMESDRMAALLDVLDETKLANQREVVRNERRQRYENPPYGTAWADLYAALYPEGHPYHHPTIGSHADLQAATLDDVSAFFRTWYVPNNATLVVAGDFDIGTARRLVIENFGWIPRGADPTHRLPDPVRLTSEHVIRQAARVPDGKTWIAWHSPASMTDDDAALDLAAEILCGGKDARLYQRLVEQEQIARDVGCSQGSRSLGSAFLVTATGTTPDALDRIDAVVREELAALGGTKPPTAEELQGALTAYEVGFYSSLETIAGKAGAMSAYLDRLGRPDGFALDLARYERATPASIRATVAATFAAPAVRLDIVPEVSP
jgi:zinc protease